MNNSQRLTTVINYLFIFLVINYTLWVQFIIKIDSTGYGLIALSVVALIANYNSLNKLPFKKKPIVYWLIWCFYVSFNYFIHPHVEGYGIFTLYKKVFIPLIAMTVVVHEYERDHIAMLIVGALTFGVYAYLGQHFDTGILLREEGEDNMLGNSYAITSSFAIMFLALLNKTGKLNNLFFVILTVIVIVLLSITGTRKALGAGGLMLIFWLFSVLNMKKIRSWLLGVAFAVVAIWGYNWLLQNTIMGARMEFLEEQQISYLPFDAPSFLSVFGDRAPHYYYGWLSFLENPLFGVGLGQSRITFRSALYIHSEYMVQLTDNGLIGFALFVLFFSYIGFGLLRKLKRKDNMTICMLGGFTCIAFLGLTAWEWEFPAYFVAYGVIIGYLNTYFRLQSSVT